MNTTKTELLNAGESLIRNRGYNGFAFRELADEVGIKSASVHYHFPTKISLVEAIMERYHQQFMVVLHSINDEEHSALKRFERFIKFYRGAVNEDRALTLCMMIGHEKSSLPDTVNDQLAKLIKDVLAWLTLLCLEITPELTKKQAKERATFIHSSLQGGILGSSAVGSASYFDQVARQLRLFVIGQ